MSEMSPVEVVDLGIERLVHIDQRIDAHEGEALQDRWEFGRVLGAERGDKKKLPVGRLAEVCKATGKSLSEVKFRVQFAEEYDEQRLAHAVANRLSWYEIRRSGLGARAVPGVLTVSAVPEGMFATIVADPPWRYGNTSTRGAAEDHYPTMSIDDLCQLPVARDKAADESHLYLWTTAGHLPDAFTVMEAWGFTYKTYLVWVKPQMGMGNYFRVSTELVLFGVKGGIRTNDRGLMNYFTARRGKHSAKPETFYELVGKASPGPYLEMFARCRADRDLICRCTRCRLGWEVWGNET